MRTMLAAMVLVLGLAATSLAQGNQCMYGNQFFSPGDVSCQGGAQFRCAAGSWQAVGLTCSDTAADADEGAVKVDPSVHAPKVKEPSVKDHEVQEHAPPTIPRP